MKAATVLLLMVIFSTGSCFAQSVSGTDNLVLDKKVSVSLQDSTLGKVLDQLNVNYSINFSYVTDQIPLQAKVVLDISNQKLKVVLDSLFNNSNIRYFVVGSQIALRKEETAISDTVASDTAHTITTPVVNVARAPLNNTTSAAPNQAENVKLGFRLFGKKKNVPDYSPTDTTGKDSLQSDKKHIKKTFSRPAGVYSHNKFSIGLFLSPQYNYRHLSASNGNYSVVNNRNSFEKGTATTSLGLLINYSLARSVFLRSGIYYYKTGERGRFTEQIEDIRKHDLITISYTNHYNYWMFPILIGYNISMEHLSLGISTGLVVGLLNNVRSNYKNPDSSNYNNSIIPIIPPTVNNSTDPINPYNHSYRTLNWIYNLNIEVVYLLNDRMKLLIAPSFNYFISSIYSSGDNIREHPYSFGLLTGVFLTIGKNK